MEYFSTIGKRKFTSYFNWKHYLIYRSNIINLIHGQFGATERISRRGHWDRLAGKLDSVRHPLVRGMVRWIQTQFRPCSNSKGPRRSSSSWSDENYGKLKWVLQSVGLIYMLRTYVPSLTSNYETIIDSALSDTMKSFILCNTDVLNTLWRGTFTFLLDKIYMVILPLIF